MCTMIINEKLNGVELSFEKKPSSDILNNLKECGFRWHNVKKVWYARQNDKTITLAKQLTAQDIKDIEQEHKTEKATQEVKTEQRKTGNNNNLLPLFDRVQIADDVNNYNPSYGYGGKEITKVVRQHIRQRFPECKFSITCSNYDSVSIELKSSPYNHTSYDSKYENMDRYEYNRMVKENDKELTAIIDYCKKYLNSFKHCTCYDPYGDYGSSYNIYTHVDISSYDYEQIEQTEEHKTIIEEFRKALEIKEQQDEEQRKIEVEEAIKQREIEKEENKRIAEQEEKQIEIIINNVSFVDLMENDQYMLIGCKFAHLNKNNTIDEYIEEVEKGENEDGFNYQDIKITREVNFKTFEALELYKNMLSHDFDFIGGTGGSYTDDPRCNSMTDYSNMSKKEKETVKWNLTGLAVYFNNQLQFVIDPQGFNYARYVGLTDTAEREENANTYNNSSYGISTEEAEAIARDKIVASGIEDISTEIIYKNELITDWQTSDVYKTALKQQLKENNITLTKGIIQQTEIEELKQYLYGFIEHINGVQEQFTEANIKDGDKITIFCISDFGMVTESRVKMHSVTNCKYAQYDDAVKTVFTPENKRKQYYTYYHSNKCFIVASGWHTIPETILWNVEVKNGFTCRSSKYGSCDNQQIKDIKDYLKQNNVNILVDRSDR